MRVENNLRAIAAALATCAIFASSSALAVDGEILISQGKVNAGGITPGDAAGFPATISRPGRYKLIGNLSVPTSVDGIEVTARDVTIDLNGYTIASNVMHGARYGVVSSSEGLRVTNGTLTGFSDEGVYHQAEGRGVVENMRVMSNGTGGSGAGVYFYGRGHVRNSTISGNVFGIYCPFNCVIEHNLVTGNEAMGILLGGGTVNGNVIVGNANVGISVDPSTRTGYGSNILVGNNGGGPQVSGTAAAQLHPNACDPACP